MKELFLKFSTSTGSLNSHRFLFLAETPKAQNEAKSEKVEQTLTPDQQFIQELMKPQESRPADKLQDIKQAEGHRTVDKAKTERKEYVRMPEEKIVGRVDNPKEPIRFPEEKIVGRVGKPHEIRFTEAEAGVIHGKVDAKTTQREKTETVASANLEKHIGDLKPQVEGAQDAMIAKEHATYALRELLDTPDKFKQAGLDAQRLVADASKARPERADAVVGRIQNAVNDTLRKSNGKPNDFQKDQLKKSIRQIIQSES
jgi:hypothetical protein